MSLSGSSIAYAAQDGYGGCVDHATILTVVTSAAIGAIVSSIVQVVGAIFERRARLQELLFTRALDLARARNETVMRAADRAPGAKVRIRDDIFLAEGYLASLKELYETGKLPEDLRKKETESFARLIQPEDLPPRE